MHRSPCRNFGRVSLPNGHAVAAARCRSDHACTRRIANGHFRYKALSLYLKSIDITGFKSFARTARLELPPGITALVGPNGSGKSNIVDAIRWCLGEQSMRDLRGQRADDVIHAGAKRALGAAEVTMTFEASDTESVSDPSSLSVARRLYRSGESEYRVNGKRVRLRDVQDALRAIGIDGTRNVVVNQGMADALLAASPAERRVLLEQAAGLGGYRFRRDEARQKLRTTADNVATMQIVLAELEPRLRLLRRQVRAVQERDAARERLRVALQSWYSHRWRGLIDHLATLRAEHAVAATNRQSAEDALRELESRAESGVRMQRAWKLRFDAADAAFRALRAEVDATKDEAREAQSRLEAARRNMSELDERIRMARSRLDSTDECLQDTTLAREDNGRLLAATQERVRAAREDSEERTRRARELEQLVAARQDHVSQLAAERTKATRERDMAQHEQEVFSRRREDAKVRSTETANLLAVAERERTFAQQATARAEQSVAQARQTVDELQKSVSAVSCRLDRVRALTSSMRATMVSAGRQSETESRMAASLQADVGGIVLSRLSVSDNWSLAVASALGAWAAAGTQTSRPSTWTDDVRMAYLSWRAAISVRLPRDAVWADLVAQGVDANWPSPLHSTVLVPSEAQIDEVWAALSTLPAHSVSAPTLQVVAVDGTVRTASGMQTARQDDRAARYLHLRASALRLSRRVGVLRPRLERAEAEESRLQADLSVRQGALHRAQNLAQEAREDMDVGRSAVRAAERDIGRMLEERGRQAQTRMELDVAEEDSRQRRESAMSELSVIEVDLAQGSETAAAAGRTLTAAREASLEAQDRFATVQRENAAIAFKVAEQERTRNLLLQERERLSADRSRLEEARSSVLEEQIRAREAMNNVGERLHSLQTLLGDHESHVANLRQEQPPLLELGSLIEPRRRLTLMVGSEERASGAVRMIEGDRETLWMEIRRELEQDPSTLEPPQGEVPLDEEIRRLRSRANQYADAEPSVAAECAELEHRYDHLSLHVQDLTQAGHELREVIEITDSEMHTRFATSFAAVNREFGRVFGVMLPGGTATLEVVEPEGGVAVQAQLPGKRSRASAAFSGGERALVASCLLFGVLTIRPTPFCVLDEVDAALDESNVDRYLSALRDITTKTQIVVVTHNRATMSAADALYGLTMGDDGASSLLSLRLETYEPAV